VTSFSNLASGRGAATSAVLAPTAQPELPDHADPPADTAQEAAAIGMFAFARGPRAGTCLHEILERVDFTRIGTNETAAIVRTSLERHGLLYAWQHGRPDFDPLAATVSMLERLTRAPLPGCGLRLEQVDRAHRLSEWQFYTPVGSLSTRLVAQVLGRHGTRLVASQYSPALHARPDALTHGFLNGFVDLVFAHEDRWYIVDWKSNHLGARPADYDRETLWHAMCADDYVLQYHLYALGLHRYLRHRLNGYEYSRDFGGVYYGFLRGIEPPTERGWYFDRPAPELIDALDTAVGREPAP
jgi:exodeoxyribonuclease V beta subunit